MIEINSGMRIRIELIFYWYISLIERAFSSNRVQTLKMKLDRDFNTHKLIEFSFKKIQIQLSYYQVSSSSSNFGIKRTGLKYTNN